MSDDKPQDDIELYIVDEETGETESLLTAAKRPKEEKGLEPVAPQVDALPGGEVPTPELARQAKLSVKEYAAQIAKACYLNEPNPVKKWSQVYKQVTAIKKWLGALMITNAAFEALLGELGITAEELLGQPQLADVLLYHVVSGEVLSTDLQNGMTAETLGGQSITVDLTDGVKINKSAVEIADIHASNGVIHVIDSVLIPETFELVR